MRLRRFTLIVLVVFAFIILASCGDDDDDSSSDDEFTNDDANDDALNDDSDDDIVNDDANDDSDDDTDDAVEYDPGLPGPWPVGNRTFIFTDEGRHDPATQSDRMLVTEVWYPAAPEAADMPRDVLESFMGDWSDEVYEMLAEEGAPPEEIANFERETGSVRDAPINKADGPYPLIVFSHGNAGTRFQNYTQCEYLASHGFIVVAPDHTGNSLFAPLPDELVIFDENLVFIAFWMRKWDLSFLIDEFLTMSAQEADGFFTGMIDPQKIGAMGHSFGGTAAVETTKQDPRIRATIIMASFMFPWYDEGFDASLMWMIAPDDDTMGDATFLFRLDYEIAPKPKFKLEFFDGGHYTFTDSCILLPSILGDGDGCGTGERRWGEEEFEFIEHDDAFAVINAYSTAFFGFNLRGETHMRDYLTDNHFPDDMFYLQRMEQ